MKHADWKEILHDGTVHLKGGTVLSEAEYQDYSKDRSRARHGSPSAVVFPGSIDDLVRLTRFASENSIPLVPSGGRTGYAGGACAADDEVVVSLTKMNRAISFDHSLPSYRVESGMVTAHLHDLAEQQGYYYPVDFAATGSSTIGGNVATNAGGLRVIHYGSTRNWVTGVTFVTGNGDVLEMGGSILKNNSGYDLAQLICGSEGTLGFIADVTMRLTAPPPELQPILLALEEFEKSLSILDYLRKSRIDIYAFEYMNDLSIEYACSHTGLSLPFQNNYPAALLVELDSSGKSERTLSIIEELYSNDLIADAVFAESSEAAKKIWKYREAISESISFTYLYKNDLSVPLSRMNEFVNNLNGVLTGEREEIRTVLFGHLGDGNLHLNLLKPESMSENRFDFLIEGITNDLYSSLQEMGGSISAEHGIGLLKRDLLPCTRSRVEIELMRSIKTAFDPAGIMNPGKIFSL